ncbi:Protein required for ethanol metabolism, partial [Ascosphaera acerosa]
APDRSALVLFGAGDVIAQQAVDRVGVQNHDFLRTGRMALYGGVIFGPAATTWYKFLDRHIVVRSSAAMTLAARVTADQTLWTPVHLCAFLSSMSILEGNDPVQKVRDNFKRTYLANIALWPAVQALNFTFTPLQHRLLVVNLVALGEFGRLLTLIREKSLRSPG